MYAGTPDAGSNVDAGVTIKCLLDGRPVHATLKYPMPLASHILPDGTLDLSVAAIQDLADMYKTGIGGIARLSDGEAITDFVSGKLDK